jgi:hypothetical protein
MIDFRPKRNKHGWKTKGKHIMNPSVCNRFRSRRKFLLSYEGKRIGMGKLGKSVIRGWDGPERLCHWNGYEYDAKEHFFRVSEGKHYSEIVEDLKRRTKGMDRRYGLNALKEFKDRFIQGSSRYYVHRSDYYFDDQGIFRYGGTERTYRIRGMKRRDMEYNLEHFSLCGDLDNQASKYYVGKLMVHLIHGGKRLKEPVDVWMIDYGRFNGARKNSIKDWILQEKYWRVYVAGIGEQIFQQVIRGSIQLRLQRIDFFRSRCFYFMVKK